MREQTKKYQQFGAEQNMTQYCNPLSFNRQVFSSD